MADDPIKDPQGGSGGEGNQGGQQDPNVSDPKNGDGSAGSGGEGSGEGSGEGQPQYVTPSALQGVMDAQKRTTLAEIRKIEEDNRKLRDSIEALTKSLEEKKASADKGKPADGKEAENTEVIELRRQLDELKRSSEASEARAAEERQRRIDTEFKNNVISALNAADCERPEQTFRVIAPELNHDPESGRIFATVKTEYGEEDLDLKTYIERHFKEEIMPEVFRGKMRTGGPASGDAGAGGKYQFTKDQVFNIEEYAKDPEKYRQAIESGRVRGLNRPGVPS